MSILSDLSDQSRRAECISKVSWLLPLLFPLILQDARHYVSMLFSALKTISEREPRLYVMLLIEDLLHGFPLFLPA